ncbi:MAG: hypothetical protein ABI658_33020, partial [Acidimicrobiales bacterium]
AVRHSTFDIEPNGPEWGARRVTISDNDVGTGRHNFVASHGRGAPVEDIVVINNRLRGKTMNVDLKAPESWRRSNFSFIDNVTDTAYSAPGAAIKIEGFDGVTIRGNVVRLDPRRNMIGVNLVSTCGAVIEGNQFIVAAREMNSDGYKCAKPVPLATVPQQAATPTPSGSATTRTAAAGSQAPTTASHPSAVGTIPLQRGATVVDNSVKTSGEADQAIHANEPADDTEAALPVADDRLVESPRAKDGGVTTDAIWVLAIGAAVSMMVLVPLSRRGPRKSSTKGNGFR